MAKQTTGYPGKKAAVGGATAEYAEWFAKNEAANAVFNHETATDPHNQYQLKTQMFVTAYLHRAVLG